MKRKELKIRTMKCRKIKVKKLKIEKIIMFSLLLLMLSPLVAYGKVKFPEPTSKFYVNDYAGVIDEEVEDLIVVNGRALDAKTGAQIVLVTVNFTDGIPIYDYAADLFNEWKLGSAEKNNGLLILMSIGDEDYWAVQGAGLETTLTDGEISQMLYDYLEPDFAAENYSEGAAKIYEAFIKRLGGNWTNELGSKNNADRSYNSNNSRNGFNANGYSNNGWYYSFDFRFIPSVIFSIPYFFSRFFRFLFFPVLFLFIIFSHRRRYYRRFGVPFNPFRRLWRRRYGPGSFWGHFGPPPWGGFWFGGRNSNPWHKKDPGAGPGAGPGPRKDFGPGPFSSGGNPFGRSGGSKPFGGGNSFGGRSGGGGFTRGGGAGRRK
ncbi:MAG TPA: hypothetical protein GXX37_04400 [Clostridiaceae bacterium]|nr:hypothetical protein [Clostridiaceae bacterium]